MLDLNDMAVEDLDGNMLSFITSIQKGFVL